MIIDLEKLQTYTVQNMNGGRGSIDAQMFIDADGKIMKSVIKKGCSIGEHIHITSSEINFVLSGNGKATCNGENEPLHLGVCHYCPKGSAHSMENTGEEDLVLYTVVSEKEN